MADTQTDTQTKYWPQSPTGDLGDIGLKGGMMIRDWDCVREVILAQVS